MGSLRSVPTSPETLWLGAFYCVFAKCFVFFNPQSTMRGGGYHESRKDQGKEPDRCEEEGPGLLLL
jgi:hypothetical protein